MPSSGQLHQNAADVGFFNWSNNPWGGGFGDDSLFGTGEGFTGGFGTHTLRGPNNEKVRVVFKPTFKEKAVHEKVTLKKNNTSGVTARVFVRKLLGSSFLLFFYV